jgi:glycosyltransferase involved in cell wall biosynthesis
VPIGDVRAIAEKITMLLENKPLREKMGINARKIAEEKFDIKKCVVTTQGLILSSLNSKLRRA